MINDQEIHYIETTRASISDELLLWLRYKEMDDQNARLALIDYYQNLAQRCAKVYYLKSIYKEVEYEEYLQLAQLGLIESIQRFDPVLSNNFSSFAIHRIKGSILNGLSKLTEQQHIASFVRRNRKERLDKLADEFKNEHNETELFDYMVHLINELAIGYLLEDNTIYQHGISESMSQYYNQHELEVIRNELLNYVDALPDKEQRIVQLHYYQGKSFIEIAAELNLSKGRVSQLHRNAISAMRTVYSEQSNFDLNV